MAKPKKDLSKEGKATLMEMLDYLCSKINFGEISLNNTAVICMNKLFTELNKDNRKFKI